MDRFEDLRTFVRVSELRSVTQAANELERAPSAVSRRIKELEARLNTQLLTRTTRQLNLTDAGERFLVRARQILADLEEAENCASLDTQSLSGNLRLSAPLSFGLVYLMPQINRFLKLHPGLRMDVDLDDRKVDLVAQRQDLAVRIGTLMDSTLKSRKLATIRYVVTAAPALWEQHGIPQTPDELQKYQALCYTNLDRPGQWIWANSEDRQGRIDLESRFTASNGDALVQGAIDALGVIRQPSFIVSRAIAEGKLQAVLTDHDWGEIGLYVVYPETLYLATKTRTFIDHLVEHFSGEPVWEQDIFNATDNV